MSSGGSFTKSKESTPLRQKSRGRRRARNSGRSLFSSPNLHSEKKQKIDPDKDVSKSDNDLEHERDEDCGLDGGKDVVIQSDVKTSGEVSEVAEGPRLEQQVSSNEDSC